MDVVGAAKVLAVAAAIDGRKPSDEASKVWAAILYDVRVADAEDAVLMHYRESADFIRPAHVVAMVKRMRIKRWEEHGAIDTAAAPPAELDDSPRKAIEWTRLYRMSIGGGATREQAARYACTQLGVPYRAEIAASPAQQAKVRALIEGARPPLPPRS